MGENNTTTETVGEALPKEMARVRDLIPRYESIGPAGGFAVAMMKSDLDRAAEAMAEGDTVEMIRVLAKLRDYET